MNVKQLYIKKNVAISYNNQLIWGATGCYTLFPSYSICQELWLVSYPYIIIWKSHSWLTKFMKVYLHHWNHVSLGHLWKAVQINNSSSGGSGSNSSSYHLLSTYHVPSLLCCKFYLQYPIEALCNSFCCFILQMGKLRLREFNSLSWGHSAIE